MRVLIAGGPNTGKSTLAQTWGDTLGVTPLSTDTLKGSWEERIAQVVTWYALPDPWVIEGVLVAHALRDWLAQNSGSPAEKVIYLQTPYPAFTPDQRGMAKGITTVWGSILLTLLQRGTAISYGGDEVQPGGST